MAVIAGFLSLVVVFFVVGDQVTKLNQSEFRQVYLNGTENLFNAVVESAQDKMSGNFSSITRDQKLTMALFNSNREAIVNSADPTYTRLSASGIIDDLVLADKNGKVIFVGSGENMSLPKSAEMAIDTGKSINAVELLDTGEMVITSAFLIFDRADMVGVGVFKKGLKDIADKIKGATGHDVFFINKSGEVNVATRRTPEFISGSKTEERMYEEKEIEGDIHAYGITSVKDIYGEEIGKMVTLENINERAGERDAAWKKIIMALDY